jgi:hypothetical protein
MFIPASYGYPAELFFNGGIISYYLALVVQFSFAYMGAVANMHFTRGGILAQRNGLGFIVRSPLGAALLRMSPFRIRHNSNLLII